MSQRRSLSPLFFSLLSIQCGGGALPGADAAVDASAMTPDLSAPSDFATSSVDLITQPDLAPPMRCGGLIGRLCPLGMFCETQPGQCCCDFEGTCQPLPGSGCPKNLMPVCGCDGKTYDNDCYRQMAGVSPDHAGGCTFRCGTETCRPDQVCFQGCCGAAGCMPPPPSCQDAPPACNGQPSCACIPNTPSQTCDDTRGYVQLNQFGCP